MALIIPIFIVLFFFVSPSGFFETFIALVFSLGILGSLIGTAGLALGKTKEVITRS